MVRGVWDGRGRRRPSVGHHCTISGHRLTKSGQGVVRWPVRVGREAAHGVVATRVTHLQRWSSRRPTTTTIFAAGQKRTFQKNENEISIRQTYPKWAGFPYPITLLLSNDTAAYFLDPSSPEPDPGECTKLGVEALVSGGSWLE